MLANAGAGPAPAAGPEFVEGWIVAQLLGEGAYGEVRLLVHAVTGASVALKTARGGASAAAAREAALHRALRHQHVLRCLGSRAHLDAHYTFLEYAPGGELFDRIEPDLGMATSIAKRYWRHLLLGVKYLHSRGVAHRDIKPENLLLDARDALKISDFGMATLFRHGERERLLTRVCGTLPYAAPEVLAAAERAYRAPPADIWASAVVLRAMLTGELPWERAHQSCTRFASWCRGEGHGGVGGTASGLLKRALHPDPTRRATLDQLLQHRWTAAVDESDGGGAGGEERTWRSQPAPAAAVHTLTEEPANDELSAADMDALISHSQPTHADDLLAGSPVSGAASQAGTGPLARLARRMTRVWVAGAPDAALAAAARALSARRPHPRLLTLECEGELRIRAWPVRATPDRTLLEFRRWRGCGMHFKRKFVELREALRPLAPPGPNPDPDDPRLVEPMDVA